MAKQAKRSEEESAAAEAGPAHEHFVQVCNRYVQALHDAQKAAQQQSAKAHQRFVEPVPAAQKDAHERSVSVHQKLHRTLVDTWDKEDAHQRSSEAHQSVQKALLDLQIETQNRCTEAQRLFHQAQLEAHENARQANAQAYQEYVQELLKTWAQLDAGSLDAHSLAAVGHSLVTGAQYAASVKG